VLQAFSSTLESPSSQAELSLASFEELGSELLAIPHQTKAHT
jgi:hypothetical protein